MANGRTVIALLIGLAIAPAAFPAAGPTTPAPLGLAPDAIEVDAAPDPWDYTRRGEPTIAVNPTNHDNIVMGYVVDSISNKSPLEGHPGWKPYGYTCGFSASFDGGRTWSEQEMKVPVGIIPSTSNPMFPGHNCGESRPAFAPDGTLYVVGYEWDPGVMLTQKLYGLASFEFIAMWKSTDGGRTFSVPWQVVGDDHSKSLIDPATLAPGYIPSMGLPDLRIDPTTGVMALATWGGAQAPQAKGLTNTLHVSHDGGRTWSPAIQISTDEWPMNRVSYGSFDANSGVIAATYPMNSSPNSRIHCPCVVLAISTDDGRTLTRSVVPFSTRLGLFDYGHSSFVTLPETFVALDPTRKGRLAVMVLNHDQTEFEVLLSDDLGKTWVSHNPTRVALAKYPGMPRATMNRAAMNFGPQGALAVAWRQNYAPKDETFLGEHPPGFADVYVAVSFDHGRHFSAPVKADAAPSGFDNRDPSGDDFSSVLLGPSAVHVAYGAFRPDLSAWYAQIPLADFKGSGAASAGDPAAGK